MRSRIAVAAYEPEEAAPGRLPSELGEYPPFPYARHEKRALKSSRGKHLARGILRHGPAGVFPADVHGSPLHAFVPADDDRAHNTSCVFLKLATANLLPKK